MGAALYVPIKNSPLTGQLTFLLFLLFFFFKVYTKLLPLHSDAVYDLAEAARQMIIHQRLRYVRTFMAEIETSVIIRMIHIVWRLRGCIR